MWKEGETIFCSEIRRGKMIGQQRRKSTHFFRFLREMLLKLLYPADTGNANET